QTSERGASAVSDDKAELQSGLLGFARQSLCRRRQTVREGNSSMRLFPTARELQLGTACGQKHAYVFLATKRHKHHKILGKGISGTHSGDRHLQFGVCPQNASPKFPLPELP